MVVTCETNAECAVTELCARASCSDTGTCQRRPVAVTCLGMPEGPVCGCDGARYRNACAANASGTVPSDTLVVGPGGACLTPVGPGCCTSDADCMAAGISGECVVPDRAISLPSPWTGALIGVCLELTMCSIGVSLEVGGCGGADECCWEGVISGSLSRAVLSCGPL